MATVYLHIGPPKTGSTTIQNLMWDNREVLEKHGICYPDFGYRYPFAGYRRNAHFLIFPYINENGRAIKKVPGDLYEDGLNRLEELGKKFDKIILTDEGIWWSSRYRKDFWDRLKSDFKERGLDVRIIVYFRRQDLWVQSYWAQQIKEGSSSLNFHDYLDYMERRKYPADYYSYMSRLAGLFGKDSLIIRIMEREQFRGAEKTLQSDFLDIFGLSLSDGFVVKREAYNTKYSDYVLEVKRILNYLPEFYHDKQIPARDIRKLLQNPHDEDTKHSFFAEGEQEAYRQKFAESNSRLAREFLGRKDGILFYEEVRDLPEFKLTEKDLLQEPVLICGRMMDIMTGQIKQLKENEKQLARENRELEKKLKSLREDVFWYRLKRKVHHLMGEENS